jgi:hypothetical protein
MPGIRRIFFAIGLVIITSCDPQLTDDPIPIIAFQDVVMNLNLPEFQALRNDGGMLTAKGGVRGLIVYRVNANLYRAYERNCSYHPNEAASTVDIHTSNLYLVDYSCGSQFSKDAGQPTGGPAWRPLRQYRTDVTGSTLTITSDAIE